MKAQPKNRSDQGMAWAAYEATMPAPRIASFASMAAYHILWNQCRRHDPFGGGRVDMGRQTPQYVELFSSRLQLDREA